MQMDSRTLTDYGTSPTNRMISYPNYKFIFPMKALGMYAKLYGDEDLLG